MRRQGFEPRSKPVALMLAISGVATACAIAQVWTHLEVIDHGYGISKASRQRHALRERNQRLRTELALLKDPARVAKFAASQMGFAPPDPDQIRRIRGLALPEGPQRHLHATGGETPGERWAAGGRSRLRTVTPSHEAPGLAHAAGLRPAQLESGEVDAAARAGGR